MAKEYNKMVDDFWGDKTDSIETAVPDIISSRTFGVELEMHGGDHNAIARYAEKNGHTYSRDGSIKVKEDSTGGIEVQTKILQGKDGAESLTNLMNKAVEVGFKFNGTCGTHVHFGGDDLYDKNSFTIGTLEDVRDGRMSILFERKLLNLMIESLGSFERVVEYIIGDISYNIEKPYTNEYKLVNGKFSRYCVVPIQLFRSKEYFVVRESTLIKMGTSQKNEISNSHLSVKGTYNSALQIDPKDIIVVYKEETNKYKRLKKLFFFYTTFNNVLFSMLPKERRNNVYCRKLSSTYTVKDIMKCNSQGELEKLWYQRENYRDVERDKNSSLSVGDHSSVRYHAINFHSLYYRHGTVEIRMHHGTLNPKSFLMWVQLHQKIIDSVVNNTINDEYLKRCASGYDSVKEGAKLLVDALGVKGTNIENFINHRIKKYN